MEFIEVLVEFYLILSYQIQSQGIHYFYIIEIFNIDSTDLNYLFLIIFFQVPTPGAQKGFPPETIVVKTIRKKAYGSYRYQPTSFVWVHIHVNAEHIIWNAIKEVKSYLVDSCPPNTQS